MTQSAELTGGAGFTFEGNVAATYLVSLLIEGPARGLSGGTVARVAVQQAGFGEPLDDLVVDAEGVNGTCARIALQIKRSLTISAATSNSDFREIVVKAWESVNGSGFRSGIDRVGCATGDVSSRAARVLETVCEIARDSASAESFAAHFAEGAGAGESLRETVDYFHTILADHLGRATSDAEIYGLLRHFIFLRFDLLHPGAAAEAVAAEGFRPFLRPDNPGITAAMENRLKTAPRESHGRASD